MLHWLNPSTQPQKTPLLDRSLRNRGPKGFLQPLFSFAVLFPTLPAQSNLPYHLYTDEKWGIAFGALTQPAGPEMLPVAFTSKQLDPTTQRWFPCLHALAAAASLYADKKKKKKKANFRSTPNYILTTPPG